MTAVEYLAGWRERRTYTHNHNEQHMVRFNWLAANCVGETFVDVGCALGHSTALLAELHPGAWTGIEFEEAAVVEAREQFPHIAFKSIPSVADLPSAGQFDTVVCSEVVEHVEDPEELVRALLSVASRRVLMTTPNKNVGDPGHVRIYDDRSIAELVAGLQASITKEGVFYKVRIDV